MTGPEGVFDRAQAAAVLAAALTGPGTDSVLAGFAGLPGMVFHPPRAGGLLRRGEPARLEVGAWRFVGGARLTAVHVVRGVALKTEVVGPTEGGRLLADAVLDAARDHGPLAAEQLQSLLHGMAVVHGLR
ncbi:MAG TPA: DUF5073 family protein [Pseudonocardia sp.]|jgi:hypothetical protein|uniref:DUF5073 family protein n=1 Tax=Pseudonocardia sp. TaxID=60912 RepID=UPI002F407EFA